MRSTAIFPIAAGRSRRGPAPLPGEHNEEVFVGLLGHSKDELARWQAEGVI